MKTFKEIINEAHGINATYVKISNVVSLMELARRETLIECAEIVGNIPKNPSLGSLKNSILSLDKNSLDL